MIYITDVQNSLLLFEALASPVRLQIVKLLKNGKEMNINDLATALNLTNSALTMHIKKLSQAGLIRVRLAPVPRGIQKLCSLADEKLLIELIDNSSDRAYECELDVGQYTAYKVNPTCGLSTEEKIVGELDFPMCFSYPERFKAHVLWFCEGFVSYNFPNPSHADDVVDEIQISMEISSEAPGAAAHFPADIHFVVNDIDLCAYESPGEFFDRKGRLTPVWWFKNFGQYGRMKIVSVNAEGTFLDGIRVGDVTVDQLRLNNNNDITIKISCEDQSKHVGGITLFGKNFGDFNQGIKCRILYRKDDAAVEQPAKDNN